MKRIKNKVINKLLFGLTLVIGLLGAWSVHGRHHKLTTSELLDYSSDKIVVLTGPSDSRSGGTGFEVVAPSGKVYTMTNKHICALAENFVMKAQTKYHERTVMLRILEISDEHDLCILEGIPNVHGYTVSESEADDNDDIYVLGHPHLAPNTYSAGYVRERHSIEMRDTSVKTQEECLELPKHKIVEIDMFIFRVKVCVESIDSMGSSIVIYAGNSGSPVFNSDNKVVGVIFAASNEDHYGEYVPLWYLHNLLEGY